MKAAILQSNFLPWRGYFHLISRVDIFILYDCVQYTKNDWRNRNRILSKNGLQWLTLQVDRPYSWCSIDEVTVKCDSLRKAIATLKYSYHRARTFNLLDELVISLLSSCVSSEDLHLSSINELLIRNISSSLGIDTKIISTSQLDRASLMEEADRTLRLIKILNCFGATSYLSGPSGLSYLKHSLDVFRDAGIKLEIAAYPDYLAYPQFGRDYAPGLSIADFIAHSGDKPDLVFKGIS
jgi:hypothetical protein